MQIEHISLCVIWFEVVRWNDMIIRNNCLSVGILRDVVGLLEMCLDDVKKVEKKVEILCVYQWEDVIEIMSFYLNILVSD